MMGNKLRLLLLLLSFCLTHAFVLSPTFYRSQLSLNLVEDDCSDSSLAADLDCLEAPDSKDLHRSLQNRLDDLNDGIGKRYICRTQKGFLNVHHEPGDPYDTSNIVDQLQEGQIVSSTGPPRGPWIPHDHGGWSIGTFGGFIWLEPLKE